MKIQLSDHFTYKRIFRFTLPSVLMMVFTSVYGVVDGLFVSNFVGKSAFAAINLMLPVIMILGAFGFMIGTGGAALVSKILGEGDGKKANGVFSFLVYVAAGIGVVIAVPGALLSPNIAVLVGAEGEAYAYGVLYGRILFSAMPCLILQYAFQSFFIVAEKPTLGFLITVAAGCTNMVFDAVFVVGLKWGIAGAASATVMSYAVGTVVPVFYFIFKKGCLLRLGKPKPDGRALIKTLTNGASEFVTNISISAVAMVYNYKLLRLAGENGVAAYGVLMYVSMIFFAILYGYSMGLVPVIGYNFGAQNRTELKNLYRKSILIISVLGALMTALSAALAVPLAKLFVGYDLELYEMTKTALLLYSFVFVFAGYGIFASSLFTALNNGLISAVISFARTFVFQVAAILVLPLFWGLTGAWLSALAAEVLATAVSVGFCLGCKKKYGY